MLIRTKELLLLAGPPHLRLFLKNTVFFSCGRHANKEDRQLGYDVIPVRTKVFQDKLQEAYKVRNNEWGVTFPTDLHAADAVYHQACIVNFRTRKQIPKKHGGDIDSKHVKGRPTDTVKSKVFLKETEALVESGKEQFVIPYLVGKMQEYP